MGERFRKSLLVAYVLLISAGLAHAQVSTSGTLIGTVTDATGAVISGAEIKVKDEATGSTIETKSGADGTFTVANLKPGNYIVSVALQGFKTGEFRNVKIFVGQVHDLTAKLEVGEMQSTVVVEAGAEVLETASTTIGTTITGKSIQTLPLTSRDALDLATLVPGASTTGRARQTSFMGLPKGAINITMDGINAQDNVLKSNDGFFTIIRPRIDTVEEFSISTAGQGADQSSEGAVQIRFETQRGGNEYHGGVWWYHRNDFFNSNYYFNNQKAPGEPETARQRQRLNQFGAKVGGPIVKERLFFFAALDNYRNPNSQVRQRTILAPNSLLGRFSYRPASNNIPTINATQAQWTSCVASDPRGSNGNGPVCTIDLFAFGAAVNRPLALDPQIMSLLNLVDTSRVAPGVSRAPNTSAHADIIQFNNPGDARRHFPDLRLDWNVTKNHQFTAVGHYNYFTASPDFLNNNDVTFPVGPFATNQGSQFSNRTQLTAAWRWNMAANKSNEFRWGLQSAPVSFFPDLDLSVYPTTTTNIGQTNLRPVLPLVNQPFLGFGTGGRNTPVMQFIDNFSWTSGKHSFTFGGTWTEVWIESRFNNRINTVNIGMVNTDPASQVFSSGNIPGSNNTIRTNAAALFALLSGRVSSVTGNVAVDENQRQYISGVDGIQRVKQTEFGIFGTDSWRVRPTLTFNYGVRWEYQGAPEDPKNLTYRPVGTIDGLFGVSGPGRLFAPGVGGAITQFELAQGRSWYDRDLNNFAPNVGLAWSPSLDAKWYNAIFGGPAKSVFRASYSISFTREGLNNFLSIAQTNPGFNPNLQSNPVAPAAGACPTTFTGVGTYPAGCLTYSSVLAGNLQSMLSCPQTFPDSSTFQMQPFCGLSANMFAPNLAIPTVHSWSFGIQREINPNLVFEVRYVGNHGSGLWRQVNLNETNIFENGFLQEFLNAKNNLAICRAQNTPTVTNCPVRFSNQGFPGQVNLPIMTAAFTGSAAGSQTNTNFSSATFVTALDDNVAGFFANQLAGSQTFMCNLAGINAFQGALSYNPCAGVNTAPAVGAFPVNFFRVNPHATGGVFMFNNDTHSTYNGLQVEARHRPAKGLQFNANYTWSKSLTNLFADSSVNASNFSTLRQPSRDKGISPWDLRHQFKMQLIYALPFGPGRRWSTNYGWVNRVIEGWEVSGIQRWQTGRVFQLTSGNGGTFNANDPGVELIGITAQQIQSMLEVRKTPAGEVYYFPASLISGTDANTAFIRPCGWVTPSEAGRFCQRVFLYGPQFYRADISVMKNIRITERVRMEYRAEFLNAFNNINFFFPGSETTSVPTASAFSPTNVQFGRITNAFRDVSTTDDNGGRIIQMVLRINF